MSEELAAIDRTAFDSFAELFDAAELREVIEEWHADALASLSRMAAALERGDLAEIGSLAHRAAGGALALGAFELGTRWERLREAAESGRGVEAGDLDELRAAVQSTERALYAAAG